MLDENELLFNELYEKTKDCGRVQFIKLLMEKERENQELKEQLEVGKEQYNDLVEEKENLQEQLSSNTLQFENQQKSFIEWLENMIGKEKDDLNAVMELLKLSEEDLKCNGIYKFCESFIIKLEEILSKYKEKVEDK